MKEIMKKMILIVGKTRSSKDTFARLLKERYDVEPIVSFTTRPIRANEVDGREHWFITKERMQEIKDTGKMIAYTINEKTGIEYCATYEELDPKRWYSYIINPEGIRYFLAHASKDIFIHIIYCDCDEKVLATRGEGRGEDPAVFLKRLESERFEFDYFKDKWVNFINGIIKTDKIPYDDMPNVTQIIFNNANEAYSTFASSYVSTANHVVNEYSEGDYAILHNFHGKKHLEKVSIKKIYTDAKRFDEPYIVVYEYPDTCFRLSDIKKKPETIFEWIRVNINIKKWFM